MDPKPQQFAAKLQGAVVLVEAAEALTRPRGQGFTVWRFGG